MVNGTQTADEDFEWELEPPPNFDEGWLPVNLTDSESSTKDQTGSPSQEDGSSRQPKTDTPAPSAINGAGAAMSFSHPERIPAPLISSPPSRNPAGGERAAILPPYLAPPATPSQVDGAARTLTVVIRSTGDKTRDVLRLRRIHGMVSSTPGNDRFAIHLFERGRSFMLEFPNITVGLTQDVLDKLVSLLGQENVRVEVVTFL